MTDQHSLSSDDLIDRLRRYAAQNKSEPWIPVKATELTTLLDCIEQLRMPPAKVRELAECDEGADNLALIRALCIQVEGQRKHIATLEAKCDRLADTAMARGDR